MSDRSQTTRLANFVNIALFVAACVCFAFGLHALGERRDLQALYFLVVGAISLRAASDMLRPRSTPR